MTIVGTRPEIIKLSRVISEFDKHTNHILVHTGQNYDYELNEVFFKELEIKKPDYFLNAAGKTPAETIGNVITDSDKVMEKEKSKKQQEIEKIRRQKKRRSRRSKEKMLEDKRRRSKIKTMRHSPKEEN